MANKLNSFLATGRGIKLLRALRIVKTPKRWPEIGWRMLYRAIYSKSILRRVERAYACRGSAEASLLRRDAEIAWGLSKGNVARTRGYTYVAYQLQARLANEARALGTARIGFEDLEIHARTTDAISSRAYLAGFDESLTLFEAYRQAIPRGTTAVDVGANIGIHSLVLSRCVGENGRVYSYEPSGSICEKLRENMALNGIQNVILRDVGVGANDTVQRFQPRQDEFNIGLGRFDASGPVEVAVVKLDSDLRAGGRISLIKVDVEGMELDVIRGASAILAQHRPTLVIECNRDWTLDELRDHMPYPVTISSIPETLLDRSRNLDGEVRYPESKNILVQPAPYNRPNNTSVAA
jgi:FkbM family methyltransferase